MAELIIKTRTLRPDPAFQDGDIIHAMNDLRVHFVHAEHICHSWNLDKKAGKWIDPVLAENYLAKIYQYKTERINNTEIRVTNQWTLESIIKGFVPNLQGNAIDVRLFFKRRLAGVSHLVFGAPGAEIYYHGKLRYLVDEDDYIWQEIEVRTTHRKVDYGKFPWGKADQKDHLVITVDDFDNEERAELESSVYDDKEVPPVLLKRRKNKVDWRNLPGLTQKIIDDVGTEDVKVDIREDFSFTRSQIVEAKAAVVIP